MSISTIEANENHDIFLPDGRNLVLLTGAPACSQDILLKTLMRKGEDLYDQSNGVDYFGAVFAPQQDFDLARKSLVDNILRVPDVYSIDSLDITVSGEKFDFQADIMTAYGTLTVRNPA